MDVKLVKLVGAFVCACLVGCNSVKPDGPAKAGSANLPDPTNQANQLLTDRKFPEAIKLLEPYVASMPAGWSARQEKSNKVTVHYWDDEHFTKCMVNDALNDKKVELVLGGSYSRAYYLIAYAYLELHDIKQADANLDRGLQLEPDSVILLAEKGTLNQVSGHPDVAVTYFEKAIASKGCRLDIEMGKAYRGLGVSLIDLERLDEAEKALYTSLRYSPNNPGALSELHYIDQLRSGKQKQPLSPDLKQVK